MTVTDSLLLAAEIPVLGFIFYKCVTAARIVWSLERDWRRSVLHANISCGGCSMAGAFGQR